MRTTVLVIVRRSLLALAVPILLVGLVAPVASASSVAQSSERGFIQRLLERRDQRRQPADPPAQEQPERPANEAQKRTTPANCQSKHQKVAPIMQRFLGSAEEKMAVFEQTHQRLQSFHQHHGLHDPDYDDLNTAVTSAHDKAAQQYASLIEYLQSLDCDNSQSVGQMVRDFRRDAKTLIDNLQIYRSSLNLLVQSLRAEMTPNNTTTTDRARHNGRPTTNPHTEAN